MIVHSPYAYILNVHATITNACLHSEHDSFFKSCTICTRLHGHILIIVSVFSGMSSYILGIELLIFVCVYRIRLCTLYVLVILYSKVHMHIIHTNDPVSAGQSKRARILGTTLLVYVLLHICRQTAP